MIVAQQRMSGVGQLRANLVGATGEQLALHEAQTVPMGEYAVLRLRAHGGLGLGDDFNAAGEAVEAVAERGRKSARRGGVL